jgi:hypothetical protein
MALAMNVPNDDLAATIQHALEATWGKIERTEGNKKEKPVLKLLRKDGLTGSCRLIISLLTGWLYNQSNTSESCTDI